MGPQGLWAALCSLSLSFTSGGIWHLKNFNKLERDYSRQIEIE